MDAANLISTLRLQFTQIAWVVKDITVTKKFFTDTMGISSFSPIETMRAKDFNATYYDKPSDGESLVSLAYTGSSFIELIQPTSGHSIFHDYLAKNPAGGIQHLAYSIPVAKLDQVISEFANKGFPVVTRFDHPIAKIVFFDTSKDIGVMTEIMGITEQGQAMVEKMKN